MTQFLKKDEVQLLNGGYLSNSTGHPVFNKDFVHAQKRAEYVVEFANLAKTKDFKGKKADSLVDLKREVSEKLYNKEITEFVKKPTEVEHLLTDKLKQEALSFLDFHVETSKVTKINIFLQEFNVLRDFENHGLFFESDIVKLNRLYTLEEVIDAVQSTIDLID